MLKGRGADGKMVARVEARGEAGRTDLRCLKCGTADDDGSADLIPG